MYNVSDTYKNDIENSIIQKNTISGTIYLNNGSSITLDDSIIIPNSLSLDQRATDNGKFTVGSVYISQLLFSIIINDNTITAADFYKGYVVLSNTYKLSNNTEETIPLGTYYINNVAKSKKLFTLTCYDALYLFDMPVQETPISGTPYTVIKEICDTYTGVEFGMLESDFANFVNGNINISISSENTDTYRDALSNIASLLGCFVHISRDNKLYLKKFGNESVLTVTKKTRTNSTLYEDKTVIKTVECRCLNVENSYASYTSETTNETGAILNIGDISILSEVSNEDTIKILDNLAKYLKNINFTPCSYKCVSNNALDVGDLITFKDQNDNNFNCIITHINFNYHKEMLVESEGLDTRKSVVKSSINKAISSSTGGGKGGLQSVVVKSGLYDAKNIDANKTSSILFLYLKFQKDTPVFCSANLIITATEDCDIKCEYYMNTNYILPDVSNIHVLKGTYRYTVSGILPLEFVENFDGNSANIMLNITPTSSIRIEPYTSISAIAADVTNTPKTPSSAEDFDFNINWLTLDAGLYKDNCTLVASIGQLQTDGMSFTTDASSKTAGTYADQYLNAYPDGTILVLDDTIFTKPPKYWIKDTQYLRTVILKGNITTNGFYTFYRNISIDKIYIASSVKIYNGNSPQGMKYFGATLYTDLPYGDTTFYKQNTSWAQCPDSTNNQSSNIPTNSNGEKFCMPNHGPIVWGIGSNTDLSYTVGEGEEGAGLRFNITDLQLPAGLYDSANRLICTWDKMLELGVLLDKFNITVTYPGYRQNELVRDYIKGSGLGMIEALSYLFKETRKCILPNDNSFSVLGDYVMALLSNIKVLVCPYPLTLGIYCFYYNTSITHIYFDKNTKCRVTSSGHTFAHTDATTLKIYTNASDDTSHKFFKAIATTGNDITISNNNIIYDVGV